MSPETAFEKLGEQTVANIRKGWAANGRIATGNTERSLRFEVVVDNGDLVINIKGVNTTVYTEKGRGPGKKPPIPPLKAWAKARGLEEGIAYALQAKIGREGTDTPTDNTVEDAAVLLAKEAAIAVAQSVTSTVFQRARPI